MRKPIFKKFATLLRTMIHMCASPKRRSQYLSVKWGTTSKPNKNWLKNTTR